jgi:hypothetical protein
MWSQLTRLVFSNYVFSPRGEAKTTDDYSRGSASSCRSISRSSPVFWQAECLRGITIWGWIYNESTTAQYNGLVKDGASRPAMKWLMDFLSRPAP